MNHPSLVCLSSVNLTGLTTSLHVEADLIHLQVEASYDSWLYFNSFLSVPEGKREVGTFYCTAWLLYVHENLIYPPGNWFAKPDSPVVTSSVASLSLLVASNTWWIPAPESCVFNIQRYYNNSIATYLQAIQQTAACALVLTRSWRNLRKDTGFQRKSQHFDTFSGPVVNFKVQDQDDDEEKDNDEEEPFKTVQKRAQTVQKQLEIAILRKFLKNNSQII